MREEGIGGGERNVHGIGDARGTFKQQPTITQSLCMERNVCLDEKGKGGGCWLL